MNRAIKLFSLLVLLTINTISQAQEIINMAGNNFYVELDHQTKSARITDYDHVIDDSKFPITLDERKLKNLSDKTLRIPEKIKINGTEYTITEIGRAAFADYTNFSYVSIPQTVIAIGEYAFFRTSLVKVEIPVGVTSIGDKAFGRCSKLKSVTQPQDIAMGSDVYLHTDKNLVVRTNTDMANTSKQERKQKKKQVTVPVVSDIDTNIPVNPANATSTFAIIIANENYQNDAKVDYALQDGRTFQTYCNQVLGIPTENIRFQEDATLNNMRTMINWIKNVAKAYRGNAQIIFYYAGHGVPDNNGATSLLPVDGTAMDPTTGYSLKSLYATLGELQAKNICLFLDACFSGKQRNDELLADGARGVRRAKEEAPLGNMIVFSASKDDETAHAYPAKGHGLFTYYLVKKLKETNGHVTLGELSDYINENVGQKSIVVLNTIQTPTTSTSAAMKGIWRDINLK